jgi:hypothetical protein
MGATETRRGLAERDKDMGTARRQKSNHNFTASAPGDLPAYQCQIDLADVSRQSGARTGEIRIAQDVPRLFLFEEK